MSPVTLADVTHAGVLAAIKEFDCLGRDGFLKSTRFGRSRAYYLDHQGRLYDSKPVIGYAHGVSTGTPWGPRDFSGGNKTVAQRLEALGFAVAFLPNPDWTRDKIVLACDSVESNGWRQLDANNERARALSELLQSPVIHSGRRNPGFRNPAGVALKTYDIVADSSNGNQLDKLVREEFRVDPLKMRSLARRVRELLHAGQRLVLGGAAGEPDVDEMSVREGGLALRAHLRRERDPKLRRRWTTGRSPCAARFSDRNGGTAATGNANRSCPASVPTGLTNVRWRRTPNPAPAADPSVCRMP